MFLKFPLKPIESWRMIVEYTKDSNKFMLRIEMSKIEERAVTLLSLIVQPFSSAIFFTHVADNNDEEMEEFTNV